MKLDELRTKMTFFEPKNDDIHKMYEELEATYQQLMAISQQLSNTENQYGLLIQNMSDIVWMADTLGELRYVNAIVLDILGYRTEEMVGRKLYEFMCPLHEYKAGSCKDVVMMMNRIEFKRVEMWMLHSDGNTRKVLEVNTKHIILNDEIVEIQGVGRDITERIQIERKINQKNRQMQVISEITATINQNLSLNNLDQLITDTCRNIVNTAKVPLCTARLSDSSGKLWLKAAFGKYKDEISKLPLNGDDVFLRTVIYDHQPLLLNKESVYAATPEVRSVFKNGRIKNLLVLPLNTNEATVGIMAIGVDGEYDEDYTPLFASLANNLAFAVEKSRLYQNLKTFYLNIIMTLVAAMEAKDPYTQGHSLRVSEYAVKIAIAMGLSKSDLEEIEISGILHDVGKLGISDLILTKPGPLTKDEFKIIKTHPSIGMKILENISLSKEIREGILYHHLRCDLKGYPQDSDISELPRFARIIGAADALDAMTSHRSYKDAMNCAEVIDEFNKHSGKQFCPKVAKVVLDLLENKIIIPLNECS